MLVLQGLHKPEMPHKGMLSVKGQLARKVRIVDHRLLAVEREPCLGGMMPDAGKCPHKVKVPCGPTEFAVRDHLVAKLLLLRHQLADALILHGGQRRAVDLSLLKILPRFLQLLRPQKASHIVMPKRRLFVSHFSPVLSFFFGKPLFYRHFPNCKYERIIRLPLK